MAPRIFHGGNVMRVGFLSLAFIIVVFASAWRSCRVQSQQPAISHSPTGLPPNRSKISPDGPEDLFPVSGKILATADKWSAAQASTHSGGAVVASPETAAPSVAAQPPRRSLPRPFNLLWRPKPTIPAVAGSIGAIAPQPGRFF